MTTTSSPQSSSTKSSTKRAIKRKLDDSILKKARAALGLPLEAQEDDEKQSEEPSLKWRKPRHNTTEGQLYMKNKAKRLQLEKEQSQLSQSSSRGVPKKEDKSKKSKKKRKKKKKVDGDGTAVGEVAKGSKDPDSEKRHGMEAVAYLQLWSTNRDHWKFEKRKQTWLLKNCLNADLIDDKRFQILLEYAASVKGAARQATLNEMQSLVKAKEMLRDEEEEREKSEESGVGDVMYDRAREIIQMLAE